MKTLTALIPFFNEERTIAELVHQLSQLPPATLEHCVFVNDGSSDRSLDLLEEALRKTNLSHSIISKVNGGKASAIREASQLLETSHAVILDADLELNTFDIVRMWDVVLQEKSEIVFGYRSFRAQSAFTYRYARGNQFLSHFYGILFNEVITDIMCGYKLVPSEFLKSIPYKFKNYAIEIEIPIHLWEQSFRPYEVPVEYYPRSRSDGKGITVKDAIRIILTLVSYRLLKARRI
jgi:glycosyltransferase involved in cell wall biosynthesis